jgi:hypothetical protein
MPGTISATTRRDRGLTAGARMASPESRMITNGSVLRLPCGTGKIPS